MKVRIFPQKDRFEKKYSKDEILKVQDTLNKGPRALLELCEFSRNLW